ncbi:DUF262 domain-containing protein [Bacillus wiedmannii]|uniref:DUF262 domain-containing protein n=1 Tax=Bacillus wiedmannii TaxID=1890302 RepID=UPI003F917DF2
MDFKPYDKTVKDLLISQKQFVIPRFQREYSWDKKNYQEFLEDMLDGLNIEKGTIKTTPYFLGTMLFVGNFIEGNETEIFVVDGQQRLTTITILFSALSRRFKDIGENGLSKAVFKYIVTTDDDDEEIKVLKSQSHYPFFAYFIQDEKKEYDENPVTDEEINIKNTYDYLYANLDERLIRKYLLKKNGKDNVQSITYLELLKKIRDQILNSTFISISTNDKKQANMIFEILNAKGKRLASIDLIKNKIFEVLDKTEPVDRAEDVWKSIKNVLSSRDEGIGFATFYRHYWISKYVKTTDNGLYDSFKKKIKPDNKQSYKAFLDDLVANADTYIKIINPLIGDYNNRKEYQWLVQSLNSLNKTFNIVQVRIALLALFDAKSRGVLSTQNFKKTILFLENFHFAFNAVVSGRASKFEQIYSTFAIKLRKCDNTTESNEVIETELKNKLNPLLPDLEEFTSHFIKLNFSKKKRATNIITKYAINQLNIHFSQKEVFENDGSVEHILPEKEGIEQNIGNLILLEQPLNEEADNLNFEDKRCILAESSYKEVQEFIENNSIWSTELVKNRANTLAKIYYDDIIMNHCQ